MPESTAASADAAIRQSLGLQVTAPPPARVASTTPPPLPSGGQEVEELKAQNELLRNQMTQMNENMTRLMGELETRTQQRQQEEVKLPSDEELEAMPRTEAIKRVAEVKAVEVINQRLMPGLRKMAGDLLETKAFADETIIQRTFPNLKMEKYRTALSEKRASNPGLSALDAIRLIADPGDLTLSPIQPRSQEAVHVESRGRSSAPPAQQQTNQSGPSEAELRQGFVDARKAGNRLLAEKYLTAIMKGRPDVPATRGI